MNICLLGSGLSELNKALGTMATYCVYFYVNLGVKRYRVMKVIYSNLLEGYCFGKIIIIIYF